MGYWILSYVSTIKYILVKFIYSEKATNVCEISTVDFSHLVTVKSTVEISQNFVTFSESMYFTCVRVGYVLIYYVRMYLAI